MYAIRSYYEEDLRRIFAAAGKRLSVPVWYGFPAGHGPVNFPLPFGVRARVDSRGRLFLLVITSYSIHYTKLYDAGGLPI